MLNTHKATWALLVAGVAGAVVFTAGRARADGCNSWTSVTAPTYGQAFYNTATCANGSYYENAYFGAALGSYQAGTGVVAYGQSNDGRGYYVDLYIYCPYDSPQQWHTPGVIGPFSASDQGEQMACDGQSAISEAIGYVYLW